MHHWREDECTLGSKSNHVSSFLQSTASSPWRYRLEKRRNMIWLPLLLKSWMCLHQTTPADSDNIITQVQDSPWLPPGLSACLPATACWWVCPGCCGCTAWCHGGRRSRHVHGSPGSHHLQHYTQKNLLDEHFHDTASRLCFRDGCRDVQYRKTAGFIDFKITDCSWWFLVCRTIAGLCSVHLLSYSD